jgi:hypothetical protein
MSSPQSVRFVPFILLTGDVIALLLFVFAGQRDHELVDPNQPVVGVILAALPFLPAWIVAGAWLGAFRFELDDHKSRPYAFLGRALNAWLVAAPFGIVLRALILGRAVIPTLFVIAAAGFGGLFLLAWRCLFVLVWRALKNRA